VTGVRLGAPDLAIEPVPPGPSAQLGIGHVDVDLRGLLGRRILGPEPVRTAEVADARLGRDARAGQDDDVARVVQPARDVVVRVVGGLSHDLRQ